MSAPPPPPPHGENPKSSGLPPGKYDIFIIPPHSSGSGFLYLPSLKPNANSFAAGFASALVLVVIGSALKPAVQQWWNGIKGSGGTGMVLLIIAIGLGAWALGRAQNDGGPGPGGGPSPPPDPGAHQYTHTNPQSNGYAGGPPPASAPPPGPGAAGPKPSWQRTNPPPGTTGASANTNSSSAGGAAKGAWEKAREETKRKEEERKAKEAAQKRKEELEKRLKEAREKEAREREAREKRQKEEEAKAKAKLQAEIEIEKEKLRAKMKEAEDAKQEAKPKGSSYAFSATGEKLRAKMKETEDAKQEAKPKGSSYAFSATGEKTNPWPRGRPPSPVTQRSQPPSPTKRPPAPTAKTYLGTDDDAYSFRPYDKPKKPMHKKSASSIYSESSYAASHSTARTTPPPSHRGPYSTKDPDKIVIKAVYAFNNAFLKTPTSQLVSGVGSVTDGLILRITTEGLFIDDDVRGVPQREWDVKAWTMKLVEVWCPSFRQGPAGNSASHSAPDTKKTFRRLWGMDKDKTATSEETDALLIDMLQLCQNNCRYAATASRSSAASSSAYSSSASSNSYDDRSSVSDSAYGSSVGSSSPSRDRTRTRTDKGLAFQTGEMKSARLHVLRASIRDQDGKKYVFIITEEESWKVAVGLQKLRKGSQARALGVSGMSTSDARGMLEHLGWA